jgi:hypothetical protein
VHSSVDNIVINGIPQRPVLDDLDLPPTLEELKNAIYQMSSGKAPGKDGIPVELYKALGPATISAFHNIMLNIWETEVMK